MKNEFISAVYRHYNWPFDFEFIESIKNLKNVREAREHFLFHAKFDGISKLEIHKSLDFIERELEYLIKKGWSVTHPGAPDYPDEFLHIGWPPIFLSYIGKPCWNTDNLISIVGGREPTADAIDWMNAELPEVLKADFGFISGAARGVDQVAHRLCLQAQKKTVAFLPTGLKYIYPKDFAEYIPDIVANGGAVVSEFLPTTEIKKGHFYERNRLIASLGSVLFVVQARIKSGSLLTARCALQAGKPICVVPWDPRDPKAMGTNQLLFDGAQPIRDFQDLITFTELAIAGEYRASPKRVLQTKHSQQETR